MTSEEVAALIKETIAEALPSEGDILEAIREGVRLAFDQVYDSQILDAIADGTKEALSEKKRR